MISSITESREPTEVDTPDDAAVGPEGVSATGSVDVAASSRPADANSADQSQLARFFAAWQAAKDARKHNRTEEAYAAFQKAEPYSAGYRWADYYNEWADLDVSSGKYEDALAKYDKAVEKEGDNGYARYRKALLLEKLGDRAKARDAFARADSAYAAFLKKHGAPEPHQEAWSGAPSFFQEWGLVLRRLGRHSEAIERFDQVLGMGEEFHGRNSEWARMARHQALVSKVNTLRLLGRNGEAEEATALARKLDPDGTDSALRLDLASMATPEAARRRAIPGYNADNPTGQAKDDCLDLENTVRALASLISSPTLEENLSLGVFGNWGSGKSFFMKRLRATIDEFAQCTRDSADPLARPNYWPNIVQVEFNAWHYVDANLWASLMVHMLEELRCFKDPKPGQNSPLCLALDRLLVATTTRDAANARKKTADEARKKADGALTGARKNLNGVVEKLALAASKSLWASVEEKVSLDTEATEALQKLKLAAEDSRASVRSVYGQLQELALTGGRLRAILLQILRAPDASRELARFAAIIIVPVFVLVGVALATKWEGLSSAYLWVTTVLGSSVAAFTKAADWIRKQADEVLELLAPLEAQRRRIEDALKDAEAGRPKEIIELEKARVERQREVDTASAELARREQDVREAEQSVGDAVNGRAVSRFIAERLASGDYQSQLGLIALIRNDFEQLSQLIRAHNANRLNLKDDARRIKQTLLQAQSRLTEGELEMLLDDLGVNRIVIYIDDLDRCPSTRVVEVLQAIHLLLAFPVFVVVVGVDSRWMAHSLAKEYPALLARSAEDEAKVPTWSRESGLAAVTPSDYLEKIFQIPLWVPPLSSTATRKLIRQLTEPVVTETEPERVGVGRSQAPSEPDTASLVSSVTGGNGHEPGTPLPGPELVVEQPKAETPVVRPAPPEMARLCQEETEAMQSLAPLIGRSPRATKRFVNSYRLLKAALTDDERSQFGIEEDTFGNLAAPMFLLAVTVGLPPFSARLFTWLNEPSETAPVAWLHQLVESVANDPRQFDNVVRVREFCVGGSAKRWHDVTAASLKPWSSRVAQFSFEDLATVPLAAGDVAGAPATL